MIVCECTFTGDGNTSWCPRHQCAKTAHWHLLCQTQPAYFELWEQGRGPGQNSDRPSNPAERLRCVHRGEEARRQQCPTCQGQVLVKVFACSLHGECSQAKELPGIACCSTCANYRSPISAVEIHASNDNEPVTNPPPSTSFGAIP